MATLPVCKLHKTTPLSSWYFDRNNLAKWCKSLSQLFISNIRVKSSHKYLQHSWHRLMNILLQINEFQRGAGRTVVLDDSFSDWPWGTTPFANPPPANMTAIPTIFKNNVKLDHITNSYWQHVKITNWKDILSESKWKWNWIWKQ